VTAPTTSELGTGHDRVRLPVGVGHQKCRQPVPDQLADRFLHVLVRRYEGGRAKPGRMRARCLSSEVLGAAANQARRMMVPIADQPSRLTTDNDTRPLPSGTVPGLVQRRTFEDSSPGNYGGHELGRAPSRTTPSR